MKNLLYLFCCLKLISAVLGFASKINIITVDSVVTKNDPNNGEMYT